MIALPELKIYEVTMEKINTNIIITAIICITILASIALAMGYNGYLLTLIVGIIAALTGLTITTPKILKR